VQPRFAGRILPAIHAGFEHHGEVAAHDDRAPERAHLLDQEPEVWVQVRCPAGDVNAPYARTPLDQFHDALRSDERHDLRVYDRIGLVFLRSARINLDTIWAGALVATGLLSDRASSGVALQSNSTRPGTIYSQFTIYCRLVRVVDNRVV
jgi:hypothetical protein